MSHLYWFWLLILVIAVAIEAGTMALTTIWAAVSSFVMIFLSMTGIPFRWQLVIFLIITIILVFTTRPFAVKKLKLKKTQTNADSLVGQKILVTKGTSAFSKGEAKAENGVIWTVQSESGLEILENSICIITGIEGNTLKIKPAE